MVLGGNDNRERKNKWRCVGKGQQATLPLYIFCAMEVSDTSQACYNRQFTVQACGLEDPMRCQDAYVQRQVDCWQPARSEGSGFCGVPCGSGGAGSMLLMRWVRCDIFPSNILDIHLFATDVRSSI